MRTDKKGSITLGYDNMTVKLQYENLEAKLEAVIVAGEVVKAMRELGHGRPSLEGFR